MKLDQLDEKRLLIYLSEKKSPGMCAAFELLGCIFGFSGIGVMVAGRGGLGAVMLLGYWCWLVLWGCIGALTFGLGFLAIPLWWIFAAASAAQAATDANRDLLLRLGA